MAKLGNTIINGRLYNNSGEEFITDATKKILQTGSDDKYIGDPENNHYIYVNEDTIFQCSLLTKKIIFNNNGRSENANIDHDYSSNGNILKTTILASSSMKTGCPIGLNNTAGEGFITTWNWDNAGTWDTQIFIPCGNTYDSHNSGRPKIRFRNGSDWTNDWYNIPILETDDSLKVNNIKNLQVDGGIYWNPCVESSSDSTDAAMIKVLKNGCISGGTELQISIANDEDDTINLKAPSWICLNSKKTFQICDSWLRINEYKGFSSGIFTGQSIVRSDAGFQVGTNGENTLISNDGTIKTKKFKTASHWSMSEDNSGNLIFLYS